MAHAEEAPPPRSRERERERERERDIIPLDQLYSKWTKQENESVVCRNRYLR